MGKFELYNIDLKNLTPGVHEFDYHLENKFFLDIDGDQVQKGKVNVHLTVKKTSMMFEMDFHIEGVVIVSCDRCLDDMEQPVESDNRLVVKFGKEYSEENDEIVIIPEEEGKINIAWFLYSRPMRLCRSTAPASRIGTAQAAKRPSSSSPRTPTNTISTCKRTCTS